MTRAAWWRIERRDLAWLLALTVTAGVLRFASPIFLDGFSHPLSGPWVSAWGIGHSYQYAVAPREPCASTIAPCTPWVFDELYFANDAHFDLLGQDYFDPEPPLAKLIMAAGIRLFGFNALGWRVMGGLFGTALIPLLYLLTRQLLPIRLFAILAGLLATFDGLTLVEARTGKIDIFPITFVIAAYLAFHLHLRADTVWRQRISIVFTGLLLGLAVASKWTALAAFGVTGVILAVRLASGHVRYNGLTAVVAVASLLALAPAVYLASFGRYVTIAHSITNFAAPALGFSPFHFDLGRAWHELVVWHVDTFRYHYTLTAPHPFYSPPYSWPFLYKPVAYYSQNLELGRDRSTGMPLVGFIFDLGNPVIWWGSLPAMLGTAWLAARRSYPAAFILFGLAAAWLPFWLIPRGLFLYHMLGGLPFMFLAVALVLTHLRPQRVFLGAPIRAWLYAGPPLYAYAATVVGVFLFFYPLWTGLPLTQAAWWQRIWFPTWNCCF
jgi:dolichyl-phosphate-mannose-protein mannosyltransferase